MVQLLRRPTVAEIGLGNYEPRSTASGGDRVRSAYYRKASV
jgi:hypothetical protein